jgi:NIMA (never in mitosis gene a)-related kinase
LQVIHISYQKSKFSTTFLKMSLQDFEFHEKLGEGAFSTVFRVTRKADSLVYALKQVKLSGLSRKEKENALNEIRILASFDHPNIISFKEAFLDEKSSTLCIVMELAVGGDLLKIIAKHRKDRTRVPENVVWDILKGSLNGLSVLHSSKILHRDLKSANIFLDLNGNPKLGDLNVSKVVKQGLAYTQTGTPYYASPEIWKDQPYNSASDIWSLGCVVYELASLNPPFNGKDMSALCRNVVRGIFTDVPGYSKELNKTIRSMLQVTPTLRPSAKDLLLVPSVGTRHSLDLSKCELLKTIVFDNRVSTLRSRLPQSQYKRKLSADDFKENLPVIEETDEKPQNHSTEKPIIRLPKIPLSKPLPPKYPPTSPSSPKKQALSPLISNHSKCPIIRRIGSLVIEPKRYHSPQLPILDRIASLNLIEQPYSAAPKWWG